MVAAKSPSLLPLNWLHLLLLTGSGEQTTVHKLLHTHLSQRRMSAVDEIDEFL